MKTMGLSRLVLVSPRKFPDAEATARAAGANDILEQSVICTSLQEALEGTVLSLAVTARRRDLATPIRWPRQAAQELTAAALGGEVALVFGNETAGLSNDEVGLCQAPVSIPANPGFSSLNLGSAVQLLCYELRMAAVDPGEPPQGESDPARFEEVEGFIEHLERSMVGSGFLDAGNPRRLMTRLRRLFSRARLEKEEVAILRGMLAAFEKGPWKPR